MSNRFPHLILNDGRRFYFGQNLAEAEEIFDAPAKQHPPKIARLVPRQMMIKTPELILTFDAGTLMRMEFLQHFNFQIPLKPYPESWKNLDLFEFPNPAGEMTRTDAIERLALWESRAQQSGARKIEPGNDLAANEFATYSEEREYWNMVGINIGKSRRAGGGGLWMDGWIVNFTTASDFALHQTPVGFFRSVSAFCDEFNTAARK